MNTNWKRYEKIKGEHEDWAKYTGAKTFYDVLNIDAASILDAKREAENIIRGAYRDKDVDYIFANIVNKSDTSPSQCGMR